MTEKLKAPVIPAKAGIQAIEVAIVFMPTCTKSGVKRPWYRMPLTSSKEITYTYYCKSV